MSESIHDGATSATLFAGGRKNGLCIQITSSMPLIAGMGPGLGSFCQAPYADVVAMCRAVVAFDDKKHEDGEMITVPVMLGFDSTRKVGSVRLRTRDIPVGVEWCLARGYRLEDGEEHLRSLSIVPEASLPTPEVPPSLALDIHDKIQRWNGRLDMLSENDQLIVRSIIKAVVLRTRETPHA